ncbi:hypothetical protein ACFXTI_026185 [Malus domestica]
MASPSSPSVAPRALNAMNLDTDVKYKGYLDDSEERILKWLLLKFKRTKTRLLSEGGDVKQITAKNQPPNMIEV